MGNSTYPFDIKTHTCTKIHLVIKLHTLKIAPQKTMQNVWYKASDIPTVSHGCFEIKLSKSGMHSLS